VCGDPDALPRTERRRAAPLLHSWSDFTAARQALDEKQSQARSTTLTRERSPAHLPASVFKWRLATA
jgi:hypothetical protein